MRPAGNVIKQRKIKVFDDRFFSCPEVVLCSSSFVSQLTPLAKTAIFANENALSAIPLPSDIMENMESFEELEAYLREECFAEHVLLIGDSHGHEGNIVWQDGSDYCFGYSERGKTTVLEKFPSEKEVIAYALKTLEEDRWSKAHLVAFLWDEKDVNQAEAELRSMNISFERNDIPNYHEGEAAYRIFVFGKDILKLYEFKERYICMQRTKKGVFVQIDLWR